MNTPVPSKSARVSVVAVGKARPGRGAGGRRVLVTVGAVLAGVVLLLVLLRFGSSLAGFTTLRLAGASMAPAIGSNSVVLVNTHAYAGGVPQRGDVVAFHNPQQPQMMGVARVVGLPGEQIEVRDGKFYVNGQLLQEEGMQDHVTYAGSWEMKPGELFVLGDNRNHAQDSHVWGALPVTGIVGRVDRVIWPPAGSSRP